jgi:hypothetical protein
VDTKLIKISGVKCDLYFYWDELIKNLPADLLAIAMMRGKAVKRAEARRKRAI